MSLNFKWATWLGALWGDYLLSSFSKGQNKFPHFKSRKYAQSYNSKCVNHNIKVIDNHHIKLPKLGVVYFRSGRLPQGKIKNVTVRLTVANQYYITVLTECENQTLAKTGKRVGGDWECQECCVKKETSPAWIGNSKTSNQACRDSPWIPDVLDSQIYRCTPLLASW